MTAFIVALGILIILCLLIMGMYNSLVKLKNRVKNAWSQIDVQLKRRHDLIPNLVETVKGYKEFESDTLQKVVEARSKAMQSQSVGEIAKNEGGLNDAISKFFVVVENYPDLKSNQNFLALKEELVSTENKISFARQNYNDQVLNLNNKIQMFPSNIVASMFHFSESEFFEIQDAAEKDVPKVSF
ncbi:MAG: LemA family protein [Bacillota bacterium]|nr:LemA family protein [Bacillota bacterium]